MSQMLNLNKNQTNNYPGMTPCQVQSIPVQMPDGTFSYQVVFIPYTGPLPLHIPVISSLSQVTSHLNSASLIPSIPLNQQLSQQPIQQEKKDTSATQDAERPAQQKDRSEQPAENVQECTHKDAPPQTKKPLRGAWGRPKRRVDTTVPTNVENKPKRKALEPPQQNIPPTTKTVDRQESFRQVLQRSSSQNSTINHEEDVKPIIQDLHRLSPQRTGTSSDQDLTLTSTPVTGNTSDSGTDTNSDCSVDRTRAPSTSEYKKAMLYRTVKKIRVRADSTKDGAEVGILEKGTLVKVVALAKNGLKGRIVSPLDGWVSMRKKGKKQLEHCWKNSTPTVCLRGLSTRILRNDRELLEILREHEINPTRVDWKQSNSCAFAEFATHSEANKLIKISGKLVIKGAPLKIDWSNRYRNEVAI